MSAPVTILSDEFVIENLYLKRGLTIEDYFIDYLKSMESHFKLSSNRKTKPTSMKKAVFDLKKEQKQLDLKYNRLRKRLKKYSPEKRAQILDRLLNKKDFLTIKRPLKSKRRAEGR